ALAAPRRRRRRKPRVPPTAPRTGSRCAVSSGVRQGLIEIGDDVLDVLEADADADQPVADAGGAPRFGIELPVRGRRRVAHEGLDAAEAGADPGQLERVAEPDGGVDAACDLEGEHAPEALG